MTIEDYCSFEVAKLLKEKGFNEKCRGGYHSEFDDNDNPIVMLEEWAARPYNNDFMDEGFLCSAPTLQMAMRWLRDTHNISIEPFVDFGSGDDYWWTVDISKIKKNGLITELSGYKTYEQAVEAALKYTLKNLI